MKVLTTQDGREVLTLGQSLFIDPEADRGPDAPKLDRQLLGLNASAAQDDGIVAERPEAVVKRLATAASKLDAYKYVETREFMRDLRWLNKALADVPVGTKVGVIPTGRGIRLDIPEDARPNRAEGLKVGAKVAVGPNIVPKAMMNAHGVVESLNGARATVKFDAGDIDRVKRATGKNYSDTMPIPKSSLEVIA